MLACDKPINPFCTKLGIFAQIKLSIGCTTVQSFGQALNCIIVRSIQVQ